jgi:hypothetical protein
MDIAAVRAGLATKAATVAAFKNGVLAKIPGDLTPPCGVIRPAPGPFLQYARDQSGSVDAVFLLTAVMSGAWEEQAQDDLDGLISTGAVVAAITGVIPGVSHYAVVTEVQNYGDIEVAGVPQFGCDFVIEVAGA